MPPKSLKPCGKVGCRELTRERYCDIHKKKVAQQYEQQRGTSAQRGYDWRWSKYSKMYRINNPLCVHCMKEGRYTPSEHVDHIIPVSGPHDPNFYESTNHQALCQECHNKKTIKEDKRGFGSGNM